MTAAGPLPPCGDCGVKPGQPHEDGCDVARCLVTGLQRLICDEDHDCGRQAWTGRWPGEAECEEFGWWAYFQPGRGWVRCDAALSFRLVASPDLNRLYSGEAVWDREQQRWRQR